MTGPSIEPCGTPFVNGKNTQGLFPEVTIFRVTFGLRVFSPRL